MIIVDKSDKTTINIPRNSLGNMTYNKPNVDLTDYYTKEEVDELIASSKIPYLYVVKENGVYNYSEGSDYDGVLNAIIDNKPYFIYVPSTFGYYSIPTDISRVFGQINANVFAHTNSSIHYYIRYTLTSDNISVTEEKIEYATYDDLVKMGVYGLVVNYIEEYDEYAANGVDFYTLKQAIESGNKLYSIYLPSSDNTYKIAAQEIVVVNDNEIRCITIENNGDTQITTNWTIGFDDDYFEMHISKGDSTTINIATQEWIEEQGYLTSIPDDVVTEDELNEALENIDMSYPTLIINLANSTYEGDLDEVVAAIKNDEPVNVIMRKNNNTVYLATQYYTTSTYFRCYCRYWLSVGRLEETYVQITFATNEVKKTTRETIGVVDDLTSTDATSALSANMGRELKSMIDTIAELGGGESVAYLIIKENPSENTYSYIGGSFEDVVNAYNNNKPYFIYVPNGAGVGYYSLAETTIITDTYIQCLSFAHTGVTHTWRYWRLYSDRPTLYNQTTYEYATVSQVNAINTQIGNINTILENIIG